MSKQPIDNFQFGLLGALNVLATAVATHIPAQARSDYIDALNRIKAAIPQDRVIGAELPEGHSALNAVLLGLTSTPAWADGGAPMTRN